MTEETGFRLNNKKQVFDDITVFPKKYFELGSFFGDYYSRHDNTNLWKEQRTDISFPVRFKRWLEQYPFFWQLIRKTKVKYIQRRAVFYKYRS